MFCLKFYNKNRNYFSNLNFSFLVIKKEKNRVGIWTPGTLFRKHFDIWPKSYSRLLNSNSFYKQPVFRIRIHLIRFRIHHFRLNTDPDPIRSGSETLRATPSVVLHVYELDTFRFLVSTANSRNSSISLLSSRALDR
jgi:hypothetical protein